MDLALVVDGSFRVTQSDPANWRRVLAFLVGLVGKFDLVSGRTRVAAIVYGDVGQVIFYLNTYSTRVCLLDLHGIYIVFKLANPIMLISPGA